MDLSIATNKPPIKERFLATAASWKGTKWKISVAGTKKIKSKEQASFILSVKIKKTAPLIKRAIATSIIIIETDSGKPRPTIYWTWALKLVTLPGTEFMKTALRSNLPKKFQE